MNTRLAKLDNAEYAAILLAAAGLKRLNLTTRIRSYLTLEESLPAAGQGVLGIECREDDERTQALIAPLNHAESYTCVSAERAMCRYLGGGCHVPIAAYAEIRQNQLVLQGLVGTADGTKILRARRLNSIDAVNSLGEQVAQDLLQQGAERILNDLQS